MEILEAVRGRGNEYIPVLTHLLGLGVCPLCSLRLLNIRDRIYSAEQVSSIALLALLTSQGQSPPQNNDTIPASQAGVLDKVLEQKTGKDLEGDTSEGDQNPPCLVCLGLLQNLSRGEGNASSSLEAPGRLVVDTSAAQAPGGTSAAGAGEVLVDEGGLGPTAGKVAVAAEMPSGRAVAIEQIVDHVKRSGFQFQEFCLEISLPALMLIRERATWCHLQQEYRAQGLFPSGAGAPVKESVVSLKEAVKWCLVAPLEFALGATFTPDSNFRIALLYSHPASAAESRRFAALGGESNGAGGKGVGRGRTNRHRNGHKQQGEKGGGEGAPSADADDALGQNAPTCDPWGRPASLSGPAAVLAARTAEDGESLTGAVQRALAGMSDARFAAACPCPPAKMAQACTLSVLTWRTPVYVAGRYLKYSRSISQSRWLVDDERMGDGSVQELIADRVAPLFRSDGYKFQAAGREDIDVRMLGNGRPFLLEIANARHIPSAAQIGAAQSLINSDERGWVAVKDLQLAGSEKEYTALVWLSRALTPDDITLLHNTKELVVQQKTPVRVLHRRAPLTRPRTIHSMQCEEVPDNGQYLILRLRTQAGTYVKEFVHGDFGRTLPSIGSLLQCEADILQLDVTDIKMDFL
eukprot:jgi/Mesen1/7860/ME000042S07298